MKVSIITVVYNNQKNIDCCIRSVLEQTHDDIEYIIVDGGSTDRTPDIINSYGSSISRYISEPDEGIYDAMNKGILASSGDLVGILNSDDLYYSPTVIEEIAALLEGRDAQTVYGDIVYVNGADTGIIRYWRAGEFSHGLMQKGWMPPHPAFFVRRDVYERYGYYDTAYSISADYEMMLRLLHKYRVTTIYYPNIVTRMRWGGRSSSINNFLGKYREDLEAMKKNDISLPYVTLVRKNLSKLPQFWERKR